MTSLSKTLIKITVFSLILIVVCMIWVDKPLAYCLHDNLQKVWLYLLSMFIAKYFAAKYLSVMAFICALIVCYFVIRKDTDKAKPFAFIALSFFLAYFAAFVLKFILARYRPVMLFYKHLYGFHFFSLQHNLTSFPSGHVVASAAFAFALCYLTERLWLRILLIVYVVIIAVSRLVICAHFLSDTLASIYIALVSVMWLYSLMYYKKRRCLRNIVDYD